MKEFFLIDRLETLNIKKDSSLFMAITAKAESQEIYLIFEDDLFVTNVDRDFVISAFSFEGLIGDDFYISGFRLKSEHKILIEARDTIHMRLDPPITERYVQVLWQLDFLASKGVNVVNSPKGILNNNEKILPLKYKNYSTPTWFGVSKSACLQFMNIDSLNGFDQFVLKPINSFSGNGVQRVERFKLVSDFDQYINFYQGAFLVQPFISEVTSGEKRAIYFKNKLLGCINKIPAKNSFLANIAQGGSFEKSYLTESEIVMVSQINKDLSAQSVDLVAYDILAGKISEVNITCPGLLVEVSSAFKKNILL